MRRVALSLFISACLLAFQSVGAAPITIDFEEQSILTGGGGPVPVDGPDFGVSQGFHFFRVDGEIEGGWTPGDLGSSATGNTSAIALDWCATCGDGTVTMEINGNQNFTLHSFDFISGSFFVSPPGEMNLVGYYAGGGTVSTTLVAPLGLTWDSAVLDSSWSGLTRVEFAAVDFGSPVGVGAIDNLVVTAVPVPAAVYLFASGLGLLGWFRRRQS
jgi:hypothetical protein